MRELHGVMKIDGNCLKALKRQALLFDKIYTFEPTPRLPVVRHIVPRVKFSEFQFQADSKFLEDRGFLNSMPLTEHHLAVSDNEYEVLFKEKGTPLLGLQDLALRVFAKLIQETYNTDTVPVFQSFATPIL